MQSLGVYARIGLYIDAKDCGKGTAMKIKRHKTGSRMSKAVIHGDTVYLAGIVADSPKECGRADQKHLVTDCTNTVCASSRASVGFQRRDNFASQYTCYRHAKSARGFASELCRVGT